MDKYNQIKEMFLESIKDLKIKSGSERNYNLEPSINRRLEEFEKKWLLFSNNGCTIDTVKQALNKYLTAQKMNCEAI